MYLKKKGKSDETLYHHAPKRLSNDIMCVCFFKMENQTKRCITTLLNVSQTILCVCVLKKRKIRRNVVLPRHKQLTQNGKRKEEKMEQ